MMSRKFENLEDLSPFILKGRIDRIKNKIAKLERQRAAAREADQQWQVKRESERAEARKRLEDIHAKLEKVRQEMERVKNNPSSFQPRPRFWGLVAGRLDDLILTVEAKSRLSDLETQEEYLMDEEYAFEVEAGLETHPQVVNAIRISHMPSFFSFNAFSAPSENVKPWKEPEKCIRYKRRQYSGGLKRHPDGPYYPSHREADLDKQIEPLVHELSRLEHALGPQRAKAGRARELESARDE